MYKAGFNTLRTPFRGPVQHRVARPFASRPANPTWPMVSIADRHQIEQLRDQGAPYRVSCAVPAQVSLVPSCVQHEHVRLLLDPVDTSVDDLNDAFNEAMLRFGRPTSLAIHYEGKATPDTLDALCERLASCRHQPAVLELSFAGAATEQELSGMAQLLCRCPGLKLVCNGPLAVSAAIVALRQCRPGAPKVKALKLVNVDGNDPELIEFLALLREPDLHIELGLDDDASDPDDFITSLLQAGAWTGLQLSCHTAEGRSAHLQERLDACRDAHLDRLLQSCTQACRLDHQKLLMHCQAIHGGGAQLFAWVCNIAAASEPDEFAQVPIGLRSYWRALNHAQVAHTVCCNLPADTPFLADGEVVRILDLSIDFGSLPDGHQAMQTTGTALQRMRHLKAASFHHQGATEAFSDWLFMHLRGLPLERVCFDLGGAACTISSPMVVKFLSKPTLKTVICHDMQTVARLAIAMFYFQDTLSWKLKLNVRPEDETHLVELLTGIGWKSGLHLIIRFLSDHHPRELMQALHEELNQQSPQFLVKWVDIASPSYTMPPDSPLVLSVVRRHIEACIDVARSRGTRRADFRITQAFVQSIRDAVVPENAEASSSDSEDADQTSPKGQKMPPERQKSPADQLRGLDHFVGSVIDAKVLDKTDMVMLGSVNRAAREHVIDAHFPRRRGVEDWLSSMALMGMPLEQHRAILLNLFNKLKPELVDDAFLLEALRSPEEKAKAKA